ncbi:carbon-nitrogen hydrolase family protein [Aliiroseovarius sp. PTFE2010]|uniref:carbon-nitrogen hydrolase family protein n=1 Tax=Aliiroseovarius sp. PTFE2010 TaxID=3417190 RepID=UPI003CEECD3E
MKTALIQLCSGDDPSQNLKTVSALVRDAAAQGADFVVTPEVTNCVSASRKHQILVLQSEKDDQTLAAMKRLAAELGIWLLIGSLALKTDDPDGRFANRSFLISPTGAVAATYDKMHMFDVTISDTESYRESAGYRPGNKLVWHDAGFATIGLSICYDIRFPYLYRALAQAGAQLLAIPAAFSRTTGQAHWQPLLQARAIETGCFVVAPAQSGDNSKGRSTYGHSMVVSPWGDVMLDAGTDPGVYIVDIDMEMVSAARRRIPSLTHDVEFET